MTGQCYIQQIFKCSLFIFALVKVCSAHFLKNGQDEAYEQSSNKGYFKVCNINGVIGRGENLIIDAEKCPSGAWFSESIKGYRGCVCLNGIWAISHGWCDEEYYIAYGRGHCFQLDKQIQKISFLGNPQNMFERTNFISQGNGHVFQSFNNEFKLHHKFPDHVNNTTILRLRPKMGSHVLLKVEAAQNLKADDKRDGRSMMSSICLNSDLDIEDSDKAILIHKVRKARVRSGKIITGSCRSFVYPDAKEVAELWTSMKILPGQVAHIKSGHISGPSIRCSLQCMAKSKFYETYHDFDEGHPLVRGKRSIPNKSPSKNQVGGKIKPQKTQLANFKNQGEDADNFVKPVDADNNKILVVGDVKGQDFRQLELDREFTEGEKDDAVNTANMRVIKQELNWLLEGVRPPTLVSPNWKLMKKLKEVFTKACPQTEAPKFLVNAMMRLFRLFYLNSRDFYPNGHMPEEKEQMSRLETSLDNCLKDATAMEFNYKLLKDPQNQKCRTAIEETETEDGKSTQLNVTYCRCTEKVNALNFSYAQNISGEAEIFQLYRDSNLTISPALNFKLMEESETFGEYHDFPTETVWKMITFGHYYCSKYFRDMPADHSALTTRLEDLFNEEIIYRWTRPGFQSNKIWQFLYSTFSLKQFAEAVDGCVTAAKSISEYPQWLNRPTLEVRRKKRSLKASRLWNGKAYCLRDPSDAINKLEAAISRDKCRDLS